MESASNVRNGRTRGNGPHDPANGRPSHSRNKQWVAGESGQRSGSNTPYHSDGERWERGGHRGGRGIRGASRGRSKFPNVSLRVAPASRSQHPEPTRASATVDDHMDEVTHEGTEEEEEGEEEEEEETIEPEERSLETPEEREKFYQELVKARELERKKAIAEGKMDDPSIAKRLEDAISVVGTCLDMCPRFERYRRERENNLFEWETIPGTKRVDHKRAVKMYERAAGDKTLPSDLRPPHILKKTLDYLFHDLLPRGGFSQTFNFIRDRSRSVRNDFTMQHNYGAVAIECHDRCARFHILALHFERDRTGFSVALEEQQLMNTLQSLKEFYEDQRGRYESPTELEMRVYHRLIHIRDQKERHEDIPEHITSHPVFQLTTDFRVHVQRKSAPISKTSALVVDAEGMQIFGNLANTLREQGSVVMIYLVACILERLFGKEAIDDIEGIRGGLSIPDIIDGVSSSSEAFIEEYEDNGDDEMHDELDAEDEQEIVQPVPQVPSPLKPSATEWLSSSFGPQPTASAFSHSAPKPQQSLPKPPVSAFSTIAATPNVFNTPSPFGASAFPSSSTSVFGVKPPTSVFGIQGASTNQASVPSTSTLAPPANIFNAPSQSPFQSTPFGTTGSPPHNVFASTTPPALSANPSSTFSSSSSTEPTIFSVPSISSSFNATKTTSPFTNSTPPENSSFGETNILGKPSHPLVNGFSSNAAGASSASAAPTLNPKASIFTPTVAPSPSLSPFKNIFQRSSNPSPSPIPLTSNAPPTPSILSASGSFSVPSSSSKKPSSPLSQRKSTTPPTLPKINTDTSSSSFQHPKPATPIVPPALPKHQPISLPSTPTLGVQPNPLLGFLRGSLQTPTGSSQEILSPLFFPSPTTSGPLHGFSPHRKSKLNGKSKAPTEAQLDDVDLQAKALRFAQHSTLVKSSFQYWHQRIVKRVAWIEACRQSDTYNQKVKRQRINHSDKKRRISTGPVTVLESSQKKRARRRISSDYHPPRTDEELARRFKENHEEHERRWAQGSFLDVIKGHVKSKLNGIAPHTSWRLWLSMNPDSDATAIWLERKFDVPTSGDWVSEAVFSIPLTATKDPSVNSESPGIIVFECTPSEGVADDLERKYRILDDCARLRDIVNMFPAKRHFVPSLLILSWVEGEPSKVSSDFVDMVSTLAETHSIHSHHTFSITAATKNLDDKLSEALSALSLDLEGQLVRPLTIRGAFKLFEPSFMSFISEWIDNCSSNSHFDWHLFGQIVQATIAIMNKTAQTVCGLFSVELQDVLPPFDSGVADNNSAYDYIAAWLSSAGMGGNAEHIALNIQSHRDIGQDFPAREFIELLWNLTQSQTEMHLKRDSRNKLYVPNAEIASALKAQQVSYQPQRAKLGQALHMSVRRSPKRRSLSVDTEDTSIQSKRRRFSSPVESTFEEPTPMTSPYLNGRPTPSPTNTSISLAPSESPAVVTLAMLRALTKDIKKKYAGS